MAFWTVNINALLLAQWQQRPTASPPLTDLMCLLSIILRKSELHHQVCFVRLSCRRCTSSHSSRGQRRVSPLRVVHGAGRCGVKLPADGGSDGTGPPNIRSRLPWQSLTFLPDTKAAITLMKNAGKRCIKKTSATMVSLKKKYLLVCKDGGSKIYGILINQRSYFSFLNWPTTMLTK